MDRPDWSGWRLAGHHLGSQNGDRMTPERLRGLSWREHTATARRVQRAR
jgi:hypothetical protein